MSSGAIRLESNLERVPTFMIELESWPRVFTRNLLDTLLLRGPGGSDHSPSGEFWPDVFVNHKIPVGAFRQSVLWHIVMVVAIWGLSETWLHRTPIPLPDLTRNQTITYYKLSEYLPPIVTPSTARQEKLPAQPKYARQPIVSIPKLPDNKTQTIFDSSTTKVLPAEVKLPNLVAWTRIPAAPIVAGARSAAQLTFPWQAPAPVLPAPDNARRNVSELVATAPPPSVVEPPADNANRDISNLTANVPALAVIPPAPQDEIKRKLGDLNIRAEPTVRAPQLAIAEQQAVATGAAGSAPPAPSLQGISGTQSQAVGQLLALNLRPQAPKGPIQLPGANRSGIFAATPVGKPGASGVPDLASIGKEGRGGPGNVPIGIYVGAPPNNSSFDSATAVVAKPVSPEAQKEVLMAAMTRPAMGAMVHEPHSAPSLEHPRGGEIENQVFGARRYYSMILNMPNLTSAGGSWIVRYAELQQTPGSDLIAPVAVQKVDPAYPAEAMRARVEGTVVLYAVIDAEGHVGDIRVLRGIDERLDQNARAALARWHFRPATKNGSPVALETVVHIPFTLRTNF